MFERKTHTLVEKILASLPVVEVPEPSETIQEDRHLRSQYNELAREAALKKTGVRRLHEISEQQRIVLETLKQRGRTWEFLQIEGVARAEAQELKLVPTMEEELYHAAQMRYAMVTNRRYEIKSTAEKYVMRLEDMQRDLTREFDQLAAGETRYLGDQIWNSSAAMDLPRLSEKLSTLIADMRAYIEGKYW